MTVGDTFLLQLRTTLQKRGITNNFGYQQSSGADSTSICQSLTRAFNGEVLLAIQNVLSEDVGIESIYALSLNPPGRVPSELSFIEQTGAIVGEAYPADSCFVLRMVTEADSSKDNGRIFMSGINEINVTAQSVDPVFLSGPIVSLITALVGDISDPDDTSVKFRCAVVNRIDEGEKVTPPTSNKVESIFVSPVLYTQRRRRTSKTGLAS